MKIIKKISHIQKLVSKNNNKYKIGLVPTMGALHQGHLALVDRAKKENQWVIATLFVNPRQFGPKEDFRHYPRTWRQDCQKLREKKVQILFAPTLNSMYPSNYATDVAVSGLTEVLCGSPTSRGPGHFKGVTTVVAKLFNLTRPHRAYFGVKDYQQVRVIEQLNQDLNFGVKIVRCPTIREKDGLAVSSRNAYLTPSQRRVAPALYSALQFGRKLLKSGKKLTPREIRRKVISYLKDIPNLKIEYINFVDPQSLKTVHHSRGPILLAGAVKLGQTRLIDNLLAR